MPRGRFVSFEGGEGAGKSTQARSLAGALAAAGLPVLLTREPGGAPGAELLRGVLLDGAVSWSPLAETLLHFAARAEHVAVSIGPALDAGTWVVCDRFIDSTFAYQGAGQGMDAGVIAALAGLIGLRPDLTIVLDVSERTGRQRVGARGGGPDRYERQPPDFHARVRAAFRAIAAAEPVRCALLPADGSPAEVHETVLDAVRARLGLPA